MKKLFIVALMLLFALVFSACKLTISTVPSDDSDVETRGSDTEASDTVIDTEEKMLQFNFESSDNLELLGGTHGLMSFSGAGTTKDAAIAEGKLLSAFGDPVLSSEDAENSFNYIIIASTDDGRNCVLTVYGIGGTIHIGAKDQADFVYKAADALCEYVNAYEPTDYKRTTYYLDYGVQIDISVRGGIASVTQSEIPELKLDELFKKFYG